MEEPKHVNGLEINCSYYVTSVSFPNQCPDRETFLSYLAYFQKTNGLPFGIVPAEELQIKDKKREDDVERAIERAIKNNSFEVYYQPICVSETQEFINAEALVRLTDPLLGPVSPSEFIPLSDSTGSIIAIGNIVLEKVCKFLSRSDFEELGLSSIEVNLSTTQCLQRNFMSVIHDVTEKYKIEKKRLSFEITETASNLSPAVFTENLSKLQKDGYHLLLDDYGSGYSNLQRLVTTEFDVIKFDKDMIQKTCSDQKLQILYRKLQNIFHSMGAKLVAEGVATKEQYEFLKSAGCDFIQGYYFSKPLPENQFVEFLRTHKK